ncbi:hypothetical protein TthAA37_11130 [Thermus thermophilus]|uniref:Uncharacterized protein n=1 Tax=Thermus thermophilus TaxID=274 RepID=A0AAD1NY08_THETH|nr:hypothetical protein [Thermus thermophilus]BCZ86916.1 hypothetical protein TthAA11_10980 [Thermus thermophilus]BCZ91924.1 hypothetical protein TthAA37_11130 [Thermus thermophilus]
MDHSEAWRRWNAWKYVLRAVEQIAPEALEDLARLVPLYREAAPYIEGGATGWSFYRPSVYDWPSLENTVRALEDLVGFLLEEAGEEEKKGEVGVVLVKVRSLRDALLAWARRWNLEHYEPLGWALDNLRLWRHEPELAGKPVVHHSPVVVYPRTPPFHPPRLKPPFHGAEEESWPEIERRLRQAFESWLRECRALYEEWALPHRELQKHARWWVAHRVKGWSLRAMTERARLEGLVDREGRVLLEEAAPSAIAKAIANLDRTLGLVPD